MIRTGSAILLLLSALTTEATAQQRTFYGSGGKVAARSVTGSNGAVTYYDASGKVTARTSTGSNGIVTTYGADGRVVGNVTRERR